LKHFLYGHIGIPKRGITLTPLGYGKYVMQINRDHL